SAGFQSQSTPPSGALTLTASPASLSQSGSLTRVFLPTSELEQISNDVHELIPMIMMMSMAKQQQQPIQPRQ
ncbi:MAG TPA: hypothetical protein VKJ65_02855, partial [Phycisphaerae bacterium]|nr:hypothetical protein [Phycisphaerae bacterium]